MIGPAEQRLLHVVATNPGLNQSQACSLARIHPRSHHRVVRSLERKGYLLVKRYPNRLALFTFTINDY